MHTLSKKILWEEYGSYGLGHGTFSHICDILDRIGLNYQIKEKIFFKKIFNKNNSADIYLPEYDKTITGFSNDANVGLTYEVDKDSRKVLIRFGDLSDSGDTILDHKYFIPEEISDEAIDIASDLSGKDLSKKILLRPKKIKNGRLNTIMLMKKELSLVKR